MVVPSRTVEFYGQAVTEPPTSSLKAAIAAEWCPFADRRCSKIRKSDPSQTIGSCILGHGGAPLIICPKRFLEGGLIFRECASLLGPADSYLVVPEISMPAGSIDFFIAAKTADEITDYAAVELQSLDTTGTGGIWTAREDAMAGHVDERYPHGINWKMSAKTILVQMLHKAPAMEILGHKLILVLQEEFLAYIEREFTGSVFRIAADEDAVHFHSYEVVWHEHAWTLKAGRKLSTDAAGITALIGLGSKDEIDDANVRTKIIAKATSGFVFSL